MKHLVLPDVQFKPGNDTAFLTAIGNYIVDKKPDTVVCIGDFADMPSLSSYDVGKKSFEGRRYKADLEATHQGMEVLLAPLSNYNSKMRRTKHSLYLPRLVLTLGNHENRINRVVENDPKLEGTISVEDLKYADFGWEVVPFLKPIIIDGIAYCFGFGEQLLHADFTYHPVEFTTVGDKLIGFDVDGPTKKYKTAVVEGVEFDYAPTYKVVDSNKNTTVVTGDHLWLVRPFGTQYEWKSTLELKPGYEILQPFDTWQRSNDLEMAWLGGILDGEAWLSKPNTKQDGIQVGIAQNDGLVFDKVCAVLAKHNYKFISNKVRNCNSIRILGSLNDKIRLLVETNSIRLLNKLTPEMFGRLQSTGINPNVVSVVPMGEQKIVKIKTSTETLVVNGAAHHNCHYFTSGVMGRPVASARHLVQKKHMSCTMGHVQNWEMHREVAADGRPVLGLFCGSAYEHDEDYLGPQGNTYDRGVWLKHEVRNGHYHPLYASLKYLKERYL